MPAQTATGTEPAGSVSTELQDANNPHSSSDNQSEQQSTDSSAETRSTGDDGPVTSDNAEDRDAVDQCELLRVEQVLPPSWDGTGSLLCCIDIECHCFNTSKEQFDQGIRSSRRRICEIGMAILDTRALTAWQDRGDRWSEAHKIVEDNSEVFAIIEHEHRGPHNRAFCRGGKADDFRYGKPTWIRLQDARNEVVGRIRRALGDRTSSQGPGPYLSSTPVVFVFFARHNDVEWLDQLSINLKGEFPNCSVVDLQEGHLHRVVAGHVAKPKCSAEDFLTALGIDHTGAHNGGNDAVHELQGYLAECALTSEQWDMLDRGQWLSPIVRTVISNPADWPDVQKSSVSIEQKMRAKPKGGKGKKKFVPLENWA
jgi:hypothetical protein